MFSTMMRYVTTGLFLVAGIVSGCGDNDRAVRRYHEINYTLAGQEAPAAPSVPFTMPSATPPPAAVTASAAMPDLPPSMRPPVIPLAWDIPAGWQDLGPSGIRLATLVVEGQECTILTFPGDVGGDAANIRRWLGQIGHQAPDEALDALVARPERLITQGGFEARLYDLAELLPPGTPQGTLVGIIPVGEQTAFVKLTGDAEVLQRHREGFRSVCESIRLRPEAY